MKNEYEQKIDELYAEVGKLTTPLSWIKKIWPELTLEQRLDLLEREASDLPLCLTGGTA